MAMPFEKGNDASPAADATGVEIAKMTPADLPALAKVHLAAYKGYMNAGIGARYVREFLRWFINQQHAIALKSVVDGQISGYAVGVSLIELRQMNSDLFWAYLIGAITHPWVLLHSNYRRSAKAKLKRIFKLSKPAAAPAKQKTHQKCMSLISIAVSPKFAGRGAGSALLVEFEKTARELGYELLQLSVYDHNGRARAVYENSGWYSVSAPNIPVVTYEKELV